MTNPNAVHGTTSDNGLNGAQGLNGALADERFELTKMIHLTCWLEPTELSDDRTIENRKSKI